MSIISAGEIGEYAAREFEPAPDPDVFGALGFVANPGPQTQFLALPDNNLDVLFGGAAGGSKSLSLFMYALRACTRFPGLQAFWFRRTFPELQQSVLRILARYQYGAALGCRWNEGKYELRWGGGSSSILTFGHAKNVQEASALLSAEINLLIIDERTTLPPDVVDLLYTRVRSGVPGVPCLGIRSGTNPGDIGHSRVLTDYVDATQHGEIEINPDANGRRRLFLQSRLSDTPQLGEEYRKGLMGLPEKLRKAYLEGDWSVFAGQVFCYDQKVEILTENGWKLIPSVSAGERVATLSPAGEMTFEPATAVLCFPYSGDMYVHEGRALDLAVTAGHRMWTHSRNSPANFRFVAVEDLPFQSVHLRAAAIWQGSHAETVTITAPCAPAEFAPAPGMCIICGKVPPAEFRRGKCEPCYRAWNRMGQPSDLSLVRDRRSNRTEHYARHKSYTFDRGDWCELLGWYLSEGFTCTASSASRYAGRIYGFGIAQTADQAKIEQIRQLLGRMGLAHTFDGRRFRVSSTVLGAYFRQFGHHQDKFIPRGVLGWTRPHLQRLFDALMAGDGCRAHKDVSDLWVYVTTARQLADDVQELAVRLNRVAAIKRKPPATERSSAYYRVSVYQTGHDRSLLKRPDIRREHYDGPVACVTVEPHHTVLVRRNGKAMWSGNSEWRYDRHVVKPFTIPAEWRRFNGIDGGFRAPWCVIWGALDPDGRLWVYREIYETQVGETDQAKRILAAEDEGERVSVRWADDSMWSVTGEAKASAAVYAENGVNLTKAGKGPGSRVTRVRRTRTYLAEGPACAHHRSLGWDTCPLVHVFPGCANLIRTLPTLPHAKTGDPEDVETTAEDHAYDAFSYMLINLGGGGEAWLRWAKRRAAEAAAETAAADPLALPAPAPQPDGQDEESATEPGELALAAPELDPATALRQARNAALRAGRGTWQ